MHQLIQKVLEGGRLDRHESVRLFDGVFNGEIEPVMLSAVLIAMKTRTETAEEIVGAAESMRAHARKPEISLSGGFDTCGTGGDHSQSFNISTAVALILSSAGYFITKHGNRSVSSQSGSADFLEALGIPLDLEGTSAEDCIHTHHFLFLFAPHYHTAMCHAAPVRKALRTRTIFNYLGPLTNPARPRRQMIGISAPEMLATYAEAVRRLDYERVVLYASEHGMDEVSPVDTTIIFDVTPGGVRKRIFQPRGYLNESEIRRLPVCSSAATHAELFLETLASSTPTPLGKLLALNVSLAMFALDHGDDFRRFFAESLDLIHSGQVLHHVRKMQDGVR